MCLSFLIARYMARATVERSFGQMARFQHLDRAIRDEGFTLILLIRCSPVHPFAILNYLFGVTSVSFSDYTVASFIGMFPSTVMEVFFGSGLKNVADLLVGHVNKQDEQFSRIYFWCGIILTMTILFVVALKKFFRCNISLFIRPCDSVLSSSFASCLAIAVHTAVLTHVSAAFPASGLVSASPSCRRSG